MTTRWKKYQIRYSYAKEIDFDGRLYNEVEQLIKK